MVKRYQNLGKLKDQTLLILGAGQIGEACAIRALRENPKIIILHCLTKEEALIAIQNVKKHLTNNHITLVPSWGDTLISKKLMYLSKDEILKNIKYKSSLLEYYYSFLTEKIVKESSLHFLIKKWKPDIIVDGINTATAIGYQDDPYSLSRKIIHETNPNWKESTLGLLATSIIPSIIRFTQALKASLLEFKVQSYIKISTTGLGGMGDNLFYTHGDVNEPGMSSGILGKVAAAGIIHQLFWSLSHTPSINIKVVVPAALVGWQPVRYGKFRSHGKNLSLMDTTKPVSLVKNTALKPGSYINMGNYLEMPYVDSGENSAYSLGEMSAITAVGQMECVTREEIAQAVMECLNGSTKYDLLSVMDYAIIGPSHIAAIQRDQVLNKIRELEIQTKTKSIATNNLGPTVSKHLFELFLLLAVSDNSIEKCYATTTKSLRQKVIDYISNNQKIRSQIISLGIPILLDDNKALIGNYFLLPTPNEKNVITSENIEKWADSGWVDLREKRVKYWQFWLKKIQLESTLLKNTDTVILNRNLQHMENGDIGEILAYLYSIQGGERKTEF